MGLAARLREATRPDHAAAQSTTYLDALLTERRQVRAAAARMYREACAEPA